MKQYNTQNLRTPSTNEAREIGRKGGQKRAENAKKKKTLKEYLQAMLEIKDQQTGLDNATLITLGLLNAAEQGNPKAYEVIRDTLGQKPKEEIAISNIEIKIDDSESE